MGRWRVRHSAGELSTPTGRESVAQVETKTIDETAHVTLQESALAEVACPSRWHNRRRAALQPDERSRADRCSDADSCTVAGSEAAPETVAPTLKTAKIGAAVLDGVASPNDPIHRLLAHSLDAVVPCPRNQQTRCWNEDGPGFGSHASRAACQGLFPQSRTSSPWQLLLEDNLARDCQAAVLGGGAQHLRGVFCEALDLRLFERLRDELGRGEGSWSRGSTGKAARKWSLPGLNGQGLPARGGLLRDLHGRELPVTTSVLRSLCDRFDAECLVWWLNLYEDGRAGRSFHHDCSAGDRGRNATIGASFGAMRNLTFRHVEDRRRSFDFLQCNGDVFAFRESVNRTFEHGIHPLRRDEPEVGPRISVIVMSHVPDAVNL